MTREEIITILYEISMQIDYTLSFEQLANHMCETYGKKLGCLTVGILIIDNTKEPIIYFRPKNILKKKEYLNDIMNYTFENNFNKEYLNGKEIEYHYSFRLPLIKGILVLISKKPFESLFIKSLEEVNKRLDHGLFFSKSIEEKSHKESLLQQQNKLAEMGKMFGYITHQWKQPLTIINLLNTEAYQEMSNSGIDKEFVKIFKDKSELAITQLNDTINDFKTYLSTNKKQIEFNFIDTYKMALRLIKAALRDNKITIYENITNEKMMVFGYPHELSHVFVNLIGNAEEQMINKKVEEGIIQITLFIEDNEAILMIKDNAGGIPSDILPNIFDYYFSTKGEAGTGLGLYMSKKIIEEHMNGQIFAYNEGNGAIFRIAIPLIKKDSTS